MKKKWLIALASAATVVVVGLLIVGFFLSDLIRQFGPLTVKVSNQSDYDIESISFGLGKAETSAQSHADGIKSGKSRSIRPKLSPEGENSIYMVWTDERGETRTAGVCGYTESASGYVTVVIGNYDVEVQEKCL